MECFRESFVVFLCQSFCVLVRFVVEAIGKRVFARLFNVVLLFQDSRQDELCFDRRRVLTREFFHVLRFQKVAQ
jgi:hypothetical protein